MELKKIMLNDEQIKNFPLFFKYIYTNDMLDSDIEEHLMFLNTNTGLHEMRMDAPIRRFGMLYDYNSISFKTNDNE